MVFPIWAIGLFCWMRLSKKIWIKVKPQPNRIISKAIWMYVVSWPRVAIAPPRIKKVNERMLWPLNVDEHRGNRKVARQEPA